MVGLTFIVTRFYTYLILRGIRSIETMTGLTTFITVNFGTQFTHISGEGT